MEPDTTSPVRGIPPPRHETLIFYAITFSTKLEGLRILWLLSPYLSNRSADSLVTHWATHRPLLHGASGVNLNRSGNTPHQGAVLRTACADGVCRRLDACAAHAARHLQMSACVDSQVRRYFPRDSRAGLRMLTQHRLVLINYFLLELVQIALARCSDMSP